MFDKSEKTDYNVSVRKEKPLLSEENSMTDNNNKKNGVPSETGKPSNGSSPVKPPKEKKSPESRDISSSSGVVFYDAPKKDIISDSTRRIPKVTSAPMPQKKKSGKSLALKIGAVVLGALMMIGGTGCIVYYSFMNRINYESIGSEISTSVVSTKPIIKNSNTGISEYTGTLLNDDEVLNILLMGADTRANQENGNSDTMILMSIDTRNKKLKLTSFMRDTYVAIPGYEDNKLNAAFSIGGVGLTVRTIQANFGIEIDRYAVVDFSSFKNIIEVLGGIDVNMTSDEIDYINWQTWINKQSEYKDCEDPDTKEMIRAQLRGVWSSTVPESDKPINKDLLTFTDNGEDDPTAVVHLNGKQALWHARNRGEDGICSGDDYVRTQRQRQVIGIVVDMMRDSELSTIMNIIYEIGPMITTNLKTSEITALAASVQTYLDYDLISTSAPTRESLGTDYYFSDENHPIYIYGYMQSCIVISDWDNFRAKVADFVFNDKTEFNAPLTTEPVPDETTEYNE